MTATYAKPTVKEGYSLIAVGEGDCGGCDVIDEGGFRSGCAPRVC